MYIYFLVYHQRQLKQQHNWTQCNTPQCTKRPHDF